MRLSRPPAAAAAGAEGVRLPRGVLALALPPSALALALALPPAEAEGVAAAVAPLGVAAPGAAAVSTEGTEGTCAPL